MDATCIFVKSLCTADGCASETSEIALSESLADHLIAQAVPAVRCVASPAYAEAPVLVNGRLLGWMTIADRPDRAWSEGELLALDDAASAVSTEFSLRLAHQEAARVGDLVASHNRLHELIAQAAPLSEVLGELVEGIERYEPSVIPCVVLLDRESSTLHPGAGPSLPPDYLAAIDGVVVGPNIGTCGSAAWSGRLTITEDIATDPKWAPIRDVVVAFGLRHCWSMPIKAPDGEVLGTLALYGPRPRLPLPEHLVLMQDGARLAGIAIERHRTMEALIHDARHDSLTGLLNRAAIFEQLDQALEDIDSASRIAVLFIDLDGLKTLNDTLGHDRADEMIRQVAKRLEAAVRTGELVGRFGGDEFVVIAEGMLDSEQAAELGFRLLDAISTAYVGHRVDRRDRQHRHHVGRRGRHRRPRGDPPGRQRDVHGQARRARRLRLLRGQLARPEPGGANHWRGSCATPRCAGRCSSASSRYSGSPARRSWPSKRCRGGAAPASGTCRRASSCRSPRTRG